MNIHGLVCILGIHEEKLVSLSHAAHRLYSVSTVPKPSGGRRTIEAPFRDLKKLQRKICDCLLSKIPVHSALYGRPGTSQLDAAKEHLRQPLIVSMDLQDFYPSISSAMVVKSLIGHGFQEEAAELVTRLCTRKRRLPQGAPTSAALSRIVVTPVVARLQKLASGISLHCKVTMFADDLALSGPEGLQRVIPVIRSIWEKEGFLINPKKTRIMLRENQQEVLGVRVGDGLRPTEAFLGQLAETRMHLPATHPRRRGLENWNRMVSAANRPNLKFTSV